MKLCSETGCDQPAKTRGMCRRHYHMSWRHGSLPTKRTYAGRGETEAFLRRALAMETDDCILWPFGDVEGYANATFDGMRAAAHRIVCIVAHGEPPFPGAHAAHYRCGNQQCVNKRHIRWATAQSNIDDKRMHGTMSRGEKHPCATLTEAQVLAIVSDTRRTGEIAAAYGCPSQVIERIKAGRTWSWLTGIRKAA